MIATSFAFLLASSSLSARAGNNEIKKFRYQSCEAGKCIVVEAPKGWLSQSNGSFVASGEGLNQAKFQILEAGRVRHEFRGDEIVSQPEVRSITVDSKDAVVLVDTDKTTYEVISKTGSASARGRR